MGGGTADISTYIEMLIFGERTSKLYLSIMTLDLHTTTVQRCFYFFLHTERESYTFFSHFFLLVLLSSSIIAKLSV